MSSVEQLQRELAKLLPDEIHWNDSFQCLFWNKQKVIGGSAVGETELLEICNHIEKRYTTSVDVERYIYELVFEVCQSNIPYDKLDYWDIFRISNANWEQKTRVFQKLNL